MGRMSEPTGRERFGSARSARLATLKPDGAPHLVPICFALLGDTVLSVVDGKPKRSQDLQRLANVEADPRVALLADHYEDADWGRLWWVRAEGRARVLGPGTPEAVDAVARLATRYVQYRADPPTGPVLAIEVERWSGWTAAGWKPRG